MSKNIFLTPEEALRCLAITPTPPQPLQSVAICFLSASLAVRTEADETLSGLSRLVSLTEYNVFKG